MENGEERGKRMENTGNRTENTEATALITAVHRERYEILVEQESPDAKLNARLKTGVYYQDKGGEVFPTVGDWVRIQTNRCGDALILETLPRTSVFYRENPTPGMERQAVAANFDYVFLVMSMNHDFDGRMGERGNAGCHTDEKRSLRGTTILCKLCGEAGTGSCSMRGKCGNR